MAGVWRSFLYYLWSPVLEGLEGRLEDVEETLAGVEVQLSLILAAVYQPEMIEGELRLIADPPFDDQSTPQEVVNARSGDHHR